MLKYRIISFPLLLALVFFIFFNKDIGAMLFMIVAPILVGLTVYECGLLFNLMGIQNFPSIAGLASAITVMSVLLTKTDMVIRIPILAICMIVGMIPLIMIWTFVLLHNGKIFKRMVGTFGLYASLGMSYLLLCICYKFNNNNVNLLFYLLLTAKAMDTGGYIFGLGCKTLFGNTHKIAPALSPNKSWEGFFGGLLLSVVVSMAFYCVKSFWPWYCFLLAGIFIGLASFFGDLTESGIKRMSGVKDSGSWIPGMGGIFDVFDSFIYIGPCCAVVYALTSCLN
ncbi:MAG: phosphatidate cytidylyltransferase [Victivallaceae bacterium]|nr:phosphatidate cytidylyltransferase [Victivallaceae bacterium]